MASHGPVEGMQGECVPTIGNNVYPLGLVERFVLEMTLSSELGL